MHAADVNHACGISPMPVPHTAPDGIDCRLACGRSLEMRVRCRPSAWMVLGGTRTNRVPWVRAPSHSRPVRSGLEESLQESSSRSLVKFMSLYHVFQEPRARRVLRHNKLSLDNDPIALPERGAGGRSPALPLVVRPGPCSVYCTNCAGSARTL